MVLGLVRRLSVVRFPDELREAAANFVAIAALDAVTPAGGGCQKQQHGDSITKLMQLVWNCYCNESCFQHVWCLGLIMPADKNDDMLLGQVFIEQQQMCTTARPNTSVGCLVQCMCTGNVS